MSAPVIVLAGATGNLGGRMARNLMQRGARLRALVRAGSDVEKIAALRHHGADVIEVDYAHRAGLEAACDGAGCVVSALSGVRDVIIDAQTALLDAASAAGVPRFIPSDYCIDFTKLPPGGNRNLDWRREFNEQLDASPVRGTSVLSGMFTELLNGPAPVVVPKIRRVIYWGDADQKLDFTTIENTAAFTAAAALDPETPRYLRIAGDEVSARDLTGIATDVHGKRFKLLRPGGLGRFRKLIALAKKIAPGHEEPFPPWQGMQYLHDMFSGRVKFTHLDNDRYPEIQWTTVREVLGQVPSQMRRQTGEST